MTIKELEAERMKAELLLNQMVRHFVESKGSPAWKANVVSAMDNFTEHLERYESAKMELATTGKYNEA